MRPTSTRNPRTQISYNLRNRPNSRPAPTVLISHYRSRQPSRIEAQVQSHLQYESQQARLGLQQQQRPQQRLANRINPSIHYLAIQNMPRHQRVRQQRENNRQIERHRQPQHQPRQQQNQQSQPQPQQQQQRQLRQHHHQQQQHQHQLHQPQPHPSSQKDSDLPFFDAPGDDQVCMGPRVLLSTQATTDGDSIISADIKAAVHKDIQGILEGDMICDICRDVYINPLVLNCAHSFCKYCLNAWLTKQDSCPSCRTIVVFQTENLALKNSINRMVQASSQEFQAKRERALNQRSIVELSQDPERAKPFIERLSFETNGISRRVYPANCNSVIKGWRGANGATLWRTNLNDTDQAVPRDPDTRMHGRAPSSASSASNVTDSDDQSDMESNFSDYEVHLDESYASSRRRRMNDLNILAGYVAADDDADYEIEVDDSDDDYDHENDEQVDDEQDDDDVGDIYDEELEGVDDDDDEDDDDDDDDDGDGDDDDDGDDEGQAEAEGDDDDAGSSTSSEVMIVEEDSDDDSIRDRLGLFATRRVMRRGVLSSESEDSDDDDEEGEESRDIIEHLESPQESCTDVEWSDDSSDY